MVHFTANRRVSVTAIALCGLALAACGSDGDESGADAAAGTAADAANGTSGDAAGGGGEDADSGEAGGTAAGSSGGTAHGEITSVTLDCEITEEIGVGDLDVKCTYGSAGDGPEPGLLLTFTFDTDYQEMSEGDVLTQATDFDVFNLSFYADGGFGAGGNKAVEGDLQITLGARGDTTPATLSGELTDGQGGPPSSSFTLQITDVPADLP